jgi:smad nuclear-interacting protein 1
VKLEDKEKANFGLSGALAKDEVTGNVYNGVILKWTEPLDAKAPSRGWRMYVFKGDEVVETLHLHRQSAFLFGREARVADHVLGKLAKMFSLLA